MSQLIRRGADAHARSDEPRSSRSTTEAALVIERREELIFMICEAAAPQPDRRDQRLLSTLPIGGEMPGATAGAPSEPFYQPDYLLPHRQAAWALISERLGDAAELAQGLARSLPALGSVASALEGYAGRLASGG
jgi:hypothetical protein